MSENLVDGCEEYVAKVWWRSSVRTWWMVVRSM